MFTRQFLTQASLGLILALGFVPPTLAQIVPNGAGTVVNPQGNQINITGGTQAGGNLFHSFRDFNVNSAQVANFLSNPQIQNILARINGGNPSFINGLLQVTGGNSNLFLMNPAGIVFGQGASLNVPASFTATTANQIGFGNNLFNAFGDNNFSALIGNPDSFVFTTNQAGSIVNAGNLAVGNGQNISLIAGNTINTGRLTAPGGEIQVLAVPGTNRVRLSQPGQVLSLEIVPPVDGVLRAVDLPALLTGSDLPGIVVNPSGQVQVAGTSLPNQQGIAVASGRIDVSSATGNGGVVQVMGDRVAALDARINANGATGGGTVRLGGEYLGGRDTGIAPALRFNSQRTLVDRNSLIRANATVTGEGGRVIVWADRNTGYFGRITGRGATGRGAFVEISGRENLAFDGRVELPGANGLNGTLLLDPTDIIIQAGAGNGDGSLPNILFATLPDPMTISAGALAAVAPTTAINIQASNNITFNVPVFFAACTTGTCGGISFTAGGIFNTNGNRIFASSRNISISAASIAAGDIETTNFIALRNAGEISLTALNGNINAGTIIANGNTGNGANITVNASGNINATGRINSGQGLGTFSGTINLLAGGDINVAGAEVSSRTNRAIRNGDINIIAGGSVNLSALLETRNDDGNGGDINVRAGRNIFIGGDVNSAANATNGNSGAINFTSQGNIITTGFITAGSNGSNSNAGVINLTSQGAITTGFIAANSTGNGGVINLTSQGAITTGILTTSAPINGGAINLYSQGNITTGEISSRSSNGGNGGAISLTSLSSIVTGEIRSEGINPGNTSGAITINAGNLFRVLSTGFCGAGISICSAGQSGASNGAVTIRHGGGITTPFTIGDSSINGTAGPINAGTGNIINTTFSVPVPPATYTQGIVQIITTAPPVVPPVVPPPASPSTSPEILLLLQNPTAPVTPAPVVVGTPPPILIPEIITIPSFISTPPTPPPQTVVVVNSPVVPTITIPSLPPSPPPAPPALVLDRPILDPTSPGVQSPISLTAANSDIPIIDRIPVINLNDEIRLLDDPFKEEFQAYTGLADEIATLDVNQAQDILNRITRQTNAKPALIYVFFSPANDTAATNRSVSSARTQLFRNPSDTDVLEIVLVPPTGDLVRVRYPGLTRPQVLQSAGELTRGVFRRHLVYANASKRMYSLIVAPLEEYLKRLKIDNLVFLMDRGLRSMPIAAMQNKNNRFIIEDYSVALMPSLTLTDTTYSPIQDSQVMAMGADQFVVDGLVPLPGVPVELKAINQIRGGNIFFNENFTLSNLRQNRRPEQKIVHLATHGSFYGDKVNSYIQLWGTERLTLEQIRTSGFGTPPVDLLVLSACETALGNTDAELGFAGLAVTSGVRSALASLWQVSDEGTMGLMAEFYQQLQTTTTKSEALRQVQLAMLRGEVRLESGSLVTPKENFALNDELKKLGDRKLQHPYFWSAFTMIGNPW